MKQSSKNCLFYISIFSILFVTIFSPQLTACDSKGIAPYLVLYPFTLLGINILSGCFGYKLRLTLCFPLLVLSLDTFMQLIIRKQLFYTDVFLFTFIYFFISIIGYYLGVFIRMMYRNFFK